MTSWASVSWPLAGSGLEIYVSSFTEGWLLAQLLCNANKNLEVRDILRIGLDFHLTFLHESEKPEDGTQCSPFLYERKWQNLILQWHTILLVDEPGSSRAAAALRRLSPQFCHLGCMGSSFPVLSWQSIRNSDDIPHCVWLGKQIYFDLWQEVCFMCLINF